MKKLTHISALLLCLTAFGQNWKPSFQEARECAMKQDRPLVLVFSGSDWCGPCIKLDRTIWQSNDFQDYSQDHYILYRADFPRKKANLLPEAKKMENQDLAERFNPEGHFPLVVVLDKNEKVLGKTGYKKLSPHEYISLLNTFLK